MKLFIILSLLSISVISNAKDVLVDNITSLKKSVVVGEHDSLSVTVCKQYGTIINFDDFLEAKSPDKNFVRAIASDITNFRYQMFESGKGMFITYNPDKNEKNNETILFATYKSGKELVISMKGRNCSGLNNPVVINIFAENTLL